MEEEYTHSNDGKSIMPIVLFLLLDQNNGSHCDVAELETGSSADSNSSASATRTKKKTEHPSAYSYYLVDHSKLMGGPAGGGIASGGKSMLQFPTGQQYKPQAIHAPGSVYTE